MTATPNLQQKPDVNALPRSVIWRLRLGLLKAPSTTTRPTLDDLLRHNAELLEQELSQYQKLQENYQHHLGKIDNNNIEAEEKEEIEEEAEDVVANTSFVPPEMDPLSSMDPLTAMLQEQQAQEDRRQQLDLRYRKEKARRKRGLANDAKVVVADCDTEDGPKKMDADTLSIIDKDLHRLPSLDISDFDGVTIKWVSEAQRKEWTEPLREVLYIFHQENLHIGYRQGMHEVASYLWLALDIDRKILQRKSSIEGNDNPELKIQAQEQSTILFGKPAAYSLLRSILGNVRQAFDVKVASNSRPLEDMSHSILAKIKQQHNYHGVQDKLTPLLLSLSVPPQLYCTKWIRLLFSREVIGAQNVIILWDVFIELVSEGWEWMAVLETTAASRILLCRDQLLDTSSIPENTQAAHHHNAMDLLMNMPPMENIEPLVGRLNGLLELQKYTQCMHQEVAKQDHAINSQHHNQHPLYPTNGASGQHHHPTHQQFTQNNNAGFPIIGDEISNVFSLKSVRQSLEQGVERLSSSSDTWKKKLVSEWNGLKQQHIPIPDLHATSLAAPAQRSYMMDATLFGEDDDLHHQHQQFGAVPTGYPVSASQTHPNHRVGPSQQVLKPQLPHSRPGAVHTARSNHVANGLVQPPQAVAAAALMRPTSMTASTTHPRADIPQRANIPTSQGSQSPQELAHRLGNSVAILQEYFMSVARQPVQNQFTSFFPSPNGDPAGAAMPSPSKVPNGVWEALAEVEAVRTALLQQPRPQNGYQ